MKDWQVPALAIVTIKNDKIVWLARVWRERYRFPGASVTENTLFHDRQQYR